MKERHIMDRLLAALVDMPVVFVQGPRQAGKTTLVQHVQKEGHQAEYLTLDDAVVLRAAASDPDGFVGALPDRVILDEVQRVPELFRAIKRSVDQRRGPGRFLLTGSANAFLLPKLSESLAGRMEVLSLWPFSQGEIKGRREQFVDACFAPRFRPGQYRDSGWEVLTEHIVAGGYPSALARSGERRLEWFRSYLTTILERDVRDLSNVQGLRELPRLLTIAAARSGGLLNFADLARDAALPQTTLQRYWALLEAIFLVRTLPAWTANLGTRLVKSPKVMLGDTGLFCAQLGLNADRLRTDPLMTGAALETFVANELTKQITWSKGRPRLFHYRTHTQHKVDLVLEDSAGRLVGIEIKKTASPTEADFKGVRQLRDAVGSRFVRGILLHTGSASASFGADLHAAPVAAIWHL